MTTNPPPNSHPADSSTCNADHTEQRAVSAGPRHVTAPITLHRPVPLTDIARAANVPLLTERVQWVDAHNYWDGPLEGLCMVGGRLCLFDTFLMDTTNGRRAWRAFALDESAEWYWFNHYIARQQTKPVQWRYDGGKAWFASMLEKAKDRVEPPTSSPPATSPNHAGQPTKEALLGVFTDSDETQLLPQMEPIIVWVEAFINALSTQCPVTVKSHIGAVLNDRSPHTSRYQRPPFTPTTPVYAQVLSIVPQNPIKLQAHPLTMNIIMNLSGLVLDIHTSKVGVPGSLIELTILREGDDLLWLHGIGQARGELEEVRVDHASTGEMVQKTLLALGV